MSRTLRIAGRVVRRDGYIKNLASDADRGLAPRKFNDDKHESIRFLAKITPNDTIQNDLFVSYFNRNDTGSQSIAGALRGRFDYPTFLGFSIPVDYALNGLFPMEDQAGNYFTIWYGIYQCSTRTLSYASAGHPPAVALNRDGDQVTARDLATPAAPIGMFPDTAYTCDFYPVPIGGQLLLYSDGAFELPARNAEGKPWSRADFVDLCTKLAARPGWSLDALRVAAVGGEIFVHDAEP